MQQVKSVRADHQAQLEFSLEREAVLTKHQLEPPLAMCRGVL
ncbi:hypothetical protein [Cupriavidus sp. YR651]|nr:hypothetical protein [Cupriavidus sp. YR651]